MGLGFSHDDLDTITRAVVLGASGVLIRYHRVRSVTQKQIEAMAEQLSDATKDIIELRIHFKLPRRWKK